MSQENDAVLTERRGRVLLITLNRPEKLNAIDARMTRELRLAMDRAQLDESVRVIVVKGEASAFSAGLDLEPAGEPLSQPRPGSAGQPLPWIEVAVALPRGGRSGWGV